MSKVTEADRRSLVQEGQDREVKATMDTQLKIGTAHLWTMH